MSNSKIDWTPLDGTGAVSARMSLYEMRVEPDGRSWNWCVGYEALESGFDEMHTGSASTRGAAKRFALVVARQCIREDERRESRVGGSA